jgi:hypothetical protein
MFSISFSKAGLMLASKILCCSGLSFAALMKLSMARSVSLVKYCGVGVSSD